MESISIRRYPFLVFLVVANTRTKSIQKQIKTIKNDKVGSKNPLPFFPCSSFPFIHHSCLNHQRCLFIVQKRMRESSLLTCLLFPGKDRFSMDRCHYDTATTGRLDPSFGKACGWLFPYKRRPLDQLGRGNEGNNNLVFTKVNHRQHQFLYCQFSAIKMRKTIASSRLRVSFHICFFYILI